MTGFDISMRCRWIRRTTVVRICYIKKQPKNSFNNIIIINLDIYLTFRFPKDKKNMMKWIDAVRKTDWEPNFWSRICSVHFPDSNIYETKNGIRRLTNDAVPSLFLQQSPFSGQQSEVAGPSNSGLVHDVVSLTLLQSTYIY